MIPSPRPLSRMGAALGAVLLLAGGSLLSCRGPEGPPPPGKAPSPAEGRRESFPPADRARFSREKDLPTLERLVRRLAASPDPADRAEALWAVHDHRGKIALLAVQGLARSRDRRLLPHLFDRIRDREAPKELRLACLDALLSFPPSLWRDRLAALLPGIEPPPIRAAAAEVLESLPPREDRRGSSR